MIRDKQMKRPRKNELIGAFQAYQVYVIGEAYMITMSSPVLSIDSNDFHWAR